MIVDGRRRFTGAVFLAVMGCVANGAMAAPEPSSAGYTAVQRAFLREDFEQVVGLAQAFILQNPEGPSVPKVWLWMALSLDRLQETNEALRELNRLKSRLARGDPLWPELLFWEGDIGRRAFQMVRARTAYQELLGRYPDSTWALQAQLGLGLIDLHQQAFESAIHSFRRVIERAPGSPAARDARLFEGLCQLQLKQYREAISMFEPLLEQFKEPVNIAQTALYLGESLSGLERYDEAVAAYQRAVEIDEAPRWSRPALFGLGWAHYRMDRCLDSVQVFERYLSESAGDHRTEALFAQGTCLLKMEREQEALSLFERIIAHDPAHLLAIDSGLVVADISRRQGRVERAKALLRELLRQRLDQAARAQVNLRLGSIVLEEGNAAQAKTLFTAAGESEQPPIRQAALNGLGDVQMFLGDPTGARRLYEDAMQIAPDSSLAAYATYQIGRICLQLRSFDEAVELFKRLSTTAETQLSDDARLALALAYVNMGRDELAHAVLDVLRRKQPGGEASARAAYYLALMAMNGQDEPGARTLCEETIAKAPTTEEAIDARLLLADLKAREASVDEAMRWLRQGYGSAGLPRRHRAKLAKRLGDFARTQRAYAEAVVWYEEAAVLLPTLSGEAAYRIASCYEDAGDLELAMQRYRAIEQPPWRVRGQLALAKLLEREDRMNEAAAIYRSLAREDIPEAKVAEERLAALQRDKTRSRAW